MPGHKKEHPTPETKPQTSKSSTPHLPTSEEFHQSLRAQIREVARVVMEEVMQEELGRFVGAAWGEHTGRARLWCKRSTESKLGLEINRQSNKVRENILKRL
jgi:putative transposase